MKKLLFFTMLIISVCAKAQSSQCIGIIPILMGDSVVFDMTQHPFDDIVLNLNKMNNNGGYDDVFYIHTKLKQGAENDQFNNTVM